MTGRPDEEPSGETPGRGDGTQADGATRDTGAGPDLLERLSEGPPGKVYRRATSVGTVRVVVAIAALGVLMRLFALGARPMHYDEGRVAYWILHYLDSGSVTYRHGIHGPFIQLVNRWVFALLGASDFTARLPVALVGGLLPLAALLFREHLRSAEVVALALFLSFNSILVYYSRFMRSDVLLAAFMFAALGCLVRFYDTREVRYLYGVAVLAAVGFASKENAIVYALTWVGATALLADQALFRPRRFRTGAGLVRSRVADLRADWRGVVPRYAGHALGAVALFLFLLVFMYADRGAGMAGITRPPAPPGEGAVGFWEALANPVGFPGYAYDTLASATDEALRWGGRASASDEKLAETYVSNLKVDLKVLGSNAPVLVVFAVLGFVWERYGREHSRNLVLFAGYCGFVSIVGYPLADDIGSAHWLHVHILVPLAIPAAVAVAHLYRWGRAASVDRDAIATAAVAFILLLAGVQVGMATVTDGYLDTTSRENELVQFAQPQADARVAVAAIDRVGGTTGSGDVLVYTGPAYEGTRPLVGAPESENHSFALRPACQKSEWYNSLPLPWYFWTGEADVTCETDPVDLAERASREEPPLIITLEDDQSVPAAQLRESYVPRTFDMYQWSHRMTFYLHEDRVADVPGWRTAGEEPAT